MRYRELCIASLLCVASLPAVAQDVPGTWTGTFTVPRLASASVEVVIPSDSGSPILKTQGGSETPLTDVQHDGKKLLFKWGELACSLNETREGREGTCRGGGISGRLVIVRPEKSNDDRKLQHSSDIVKPEELATANTTDVEVALRKLRGLWFQGRKDLTSTNVSLVVFINNQPRGGTEVLREVRIEKVKEIRYYSGQDATVRFGTAYRGGVIYVTEN